MQSGEDGREQRYLWQEERKIRERNSVIPLWMFINRGNSFVLSTNSSISGHLFCKHIRCFATCLTNRRFTRSSVRKEPEKRSASLLYTLKFLSTFSCISACIYSLLDSTIHLHIYYTIVQKYIQYQLAQKQRHYLKSYLLICFNLYISVYLTEVSISPEERLSGPCGL
jgi:hypothetical protein